MKTLFQILLFFVLITQVCFSQSFNWAKNAGGYYDDTGWDISVDAYGNSYITGFFQGTVTFGTIQLISYGSYDIFIAKYNANGNCIWTRQAGGNSDDGSFGISTDTNGNSYVTGYFGDTATFGTIQLMSNGNPDIFIVKYDSGGNCIWAKNAGGATIDTGYDISTDANGNSYVTGLFYETATFDTILLVSYDRDDIFIAKYDVNGNCKWAKKAGGYFSDDGFGISTDANGNSYVTGWFEGTATFGTIQLVSFGGFDIFIAKYDAGGNCIWAKNAGSNSYFDICYSISTDSNGNSYLTGQFNGTAMFGTNQLVSYSGSGDIFITKYDADGNCIWAKNAGGDYLDTGFSISTDSNGNSYLTGQFNESATFGTNQLVSYGGSDIFIAKYDAYGNCVWAKNAGGIHNDRGDGISTDANGNPFVTGLFEETATLGTFQLVSYGGSDIFVTSIDNISSSDDMLTPDFISVEYLLSQNYPNPFNPSTLISWQSPVGSWHTLKIYDVLGNEVVTLVDEYKPADTYEVEWDAGDFPSGVYFYQLKAENYIETKKIILLK